MFPLQHANNLCFCSWFQSGAGFRPSTVVPFFVKISAQVVFLHVVSSILLFASGGSPPNLVNPKQGFHFLPGSIGNWDSKRSVSSLRQETEHCGWDGHLDVSAQHFRPLEEVVLPNFAWIITRAYISAVSSLLVFACFAVGNLSYT